MARKTFLRFTQAVLGWLRRVVTQPREELDRWQRAARFAYDLGRTGARQLRHDRAPQMAAALAFRTLFGLIPVLVVATILVKALRGTDAFMGIVRDLLTSAGLDQVKIIPPAEVTLPTAGGSESLATWLEGLVGQAASVNLTAVGWIGLAVILYAAIGLMVTIENCFNTICRAPEGRSWTRRVPLYWFILTVSPVAIGLMTYLDSRFDTWIGSLEAWHWLLVAVQLTWGYATAWLWMLAVYLLVPNTYLRPRPVLIGSFVAATLLQIGASTMGAYLEHA
ncbi:MAG: YihY/virulence factor BrkB family protein, partial [Pirellulales bacterium]